MFYWAYTHSLTYAVPPQLTLAPQLLGTPQGFTPSLCNSKGVLEQGQAEPLLPDGNFPHIAINVLMSHNLLTLHH